MKILTSFRRNITEQVNVFSLFLTVVLSAIAYGWIEGTLYPYYPFKNELEVLGHFTRYHLVFCFMFLVIGFTFSLTKAVSMWNLKKGYMFAASLGSVMWGFWVEDMGYYSVVREEILAPDSWVNWGMGGRSLVGHWVPTVYFLMSFIGFSLFSMAYIRSSKDALMIKKAAKFGLTKEESRLQTRAIPNWIELSKYLCSVLPFAILVQLFTILAAFVTTSDMPPGTLRVAIMGLTILVPTVIFLTISNMMYSRLSRSDADKLNNICDKH